MSRHNRKRRARGAGATVQTPTLAEVPLADVWPPRPGLAYMTVGPGQWDVTLEMAYAAGWVLVEVDAEETPVRAYRTPARN
jgi:hypothetical protein